MKQRARAERRLRETGAEVAEAQAEAQTAVRANSADSTERPRHTSPGTAPALFAAYLRAFQRARE
eukprot:15443225-Alexandrium_andersonii.AAC.1